MSNKLLDTSALAIFKQEFISSRNTVGNGGDDNWGIDKTGTEYKVPRVTKDGVMEVGRYVDFHYDLSANSDFTLRLTLTDSSEGVFLRLPNRSGTLALEESAAKTSTNDIENLWGGAIKRLILKILGGLRYGR